MYWIFQYNVVDKKLKRNIMKTFYNSMAIVFLVLWGIVFFIGSMSSLVHLLLIPVAIILIYDFIGIIKLLNET
jgi:hypothetical protein